jgi:hypothetical protein
MMPSDPVPDGELATCDAIIGHPTKPKFLVVRHSDGWQPPAVRFPPGSIAYRAPMICEGILRKYGLKTRVLRSRLSVHDYHCLELELVGPGDSRRLEAVWVDRERYLRFRTPPEGRPDPFESWLEEREQDRRPALRPPWEFPGWFDSARHWIEFQLDDLQLQSTGSVEQVRVGSNDSCVLRVPTSQGMVYFKAGRPNRPREAELLPALAETCPGKVRVPLAVDIERNWMLNRDDRQGESKPPVDPGAFPGFARTLAQIQVATMESPDRWERLGCPVQGLDYFRTILHRRERWAPRLAEGGGRLNETETERLKERFSRYAETVERLAESGLPDALVHTDFRSDHFAVLDSGRFVTDWVNCVIGHPFLALDHLFRAQALNATGATLPHTEMAVDSRVLDDVVRAYLEPFGALAPAEHLTGAMARARELWLPWRFSRLMEAIDRAEAGSVPYMRLVVQLQVTAQSILSGALDVAPAQDGGQAIIRF